MNGGRMSGYGALDGDRKAPSRVEFPTLSHFIEDVLDVGIHSVRLDTFEVVTDSQLSFVHYVSLTLFVTAFDAAENTLYQYMEDLGTETSTEDRALDSELPEEAERRVHEVAHELMQANISIRHGRYTFPDNAAM